jgi:hypothetical protein
MATKKKASADRIAVLRTHTGFPLLIRGNPTEAEVRGFVAEHNRRYHSGEPAAPPIPGRPPAPAYLILGGAWFEEENPSDEYDFAAAEEIDLAGVL